MKQKQTLWTKNFTIITLGTIISCIGGVAMNFALSFVVFDNSKSTLLMGIFSAISMIPTIILPIVISPYLDRFKRKPVIVGLDFLNGFLYLCFGIFILKEGFDFQIYLLFSFTTSAIGTIYQQAYTSYYPNLIPKGFAQKGYTVSSMIYPSVSVLITPIAAFLYKQYGMALIVFLEGISLLLASFFESRIDYVEQVHGEGKFDWGAYKHNFLEGIRFLKKEKGLQKIYMYMPISQGISEGTSSLVIAYFQTTPTLGIAMYSMFTVVEFIGRTIGGIVHYKVEIPKEKRFMISMFVYYSYAIMDALLLFSAYPLMLVNRAICGFLGINSATLRESSVQNYIPDENRAKLNAFFNVAYSFVSIVFRLLVGALGEVLDYRICLAIFALFQILCCYCIMHRNKNCIKSIYNHSY